MYNISFFLEKFKNVGLKERLLKGVVVKIIAEECGINITLDNVQLKNTIITLKIPITSKSQVFIKKLKILKRCEVEILGTIVRDIR